jgi:23S rRNA (cytosine1962-C5)-methyltransferase
MLELGHPWIIADNFTKRWPKGKAGDLVQLTDERGISLATVQKQMGDVVNLAN